MANIVKYECQVCDEKGFKSRSDWLFHLVLNRHSLKARENLQQVYLTSNGSMYVVSGIEDVDHTLLLDHVASKLSSFSNFVSFKPQADICMIVCDPREFTEFVKISQYVGGRKLGFRSYNEISPVEWKQFFIQKTQTTGTVKEEGITKNQTPNTSTKRKVNDSSSTTGTSESQSKIPKLEAEDGGLDIFLNSRNKQAFVRSFLRSSNRSSAGSDWSSELTELYGSIIMSEAKRNIRLAVIEGLKTLLIPEIPKCELIPVGQDFLGFNVGTEVFSVYLDWQGITVPIPNETEPLRTVDESFKAIDRVRGRVYKSLRSVASVAVTEVQCDGAYNIKCVYMVYDLIRVKCNIFLKPFNLAQTALLCKRLFFTNPQVMSLVSLAVYWASTSGEIAGDCLVNPYVIYWLVYYFMMTRSVLPPVIELQKSSCSHVIIHENVNIAFSYDSKILHAMITPGDLDGTNAESQLKLFLEWLTWLEDEFTTSSKGVLRHFFICPRYGKLVEKMWIRLVKQRIESENQTINPALHPQSFPAAPPNTPLDRNRKRNMKRATLKMLELGFEEPQLEIFKNLAVPETLSIQHPFYIGDNMSLAFDETISFTFGENIKKTRGCLAQILSGSGRTESLSNALSMGV